MRFAGSKVVEGFMSQGLICTSECTGRHGLADNVSQVQEAARILTVHRLLRVDTEAPWLATVETTLVPCAQHTSGTLARAEDPSQADTNRRCSPSVSCSSSQDGPELGHLGDCGRPVHHLSAQCGTHCGPPPRGQRPGRAGRGASFSLGVRAANTSQLVRRAGNVLRWIQILCLCCFGNGQLVRPLCPRRVFVA